MATKAKKRVASPSQTQEPAPAASPLPSMEALATHIAHAGPAPQPPTISPSVFNAMWTSNECLIGMLRPSPFMQAQMPDGKLGTMAEPLAILQLSPQSAKDLLRILQDGIAQYEKEWGVIETEYTRSQKT